MKDRRGLYDLTVSKRKNVSFLLNCLKKETLVHKYDGWEFFFERYLIFFTIWDLIGVPKGNWK